MTYTRVKICGITTPKDAQTAVASGADALGIVFYRKSPRCVTVAQAQEIASVVPPFVTLVSLFVNEPAEQVARILESVPIGMLQFHGDESEQYCRQFQRPWIKALRVNPQLDIATSCENYRNASGILLDAWQEGVPGGTGKTFDWNLAEQPLPLPLVLAGGLNPENVALAMDKLSPSAVDVSGGVEASPGIKDPEKIRRFITAVRAADQHGRNDSND